MMGTSETGCDLQRAEPWQVMIVRPHRHITHDDSAAHVLLRAPQHLHLPEDMYHEGHVQLQAVLCLRTAMSSIVVSTLPN